MSIFKSKNYDIGSILMKILSCNFKKITMDLNNEVIVIEPGFTLVDGQFVVNDNDDIDFYFIIKPDMSITILNNKQMISCSIDKFAKLMDSFPLSEESKGAINLVPIFKKFFKEENSIKLNRIFKQGTIERDFVNDFIDASNNSTVVLKDRMGKFDFCNVKVSFIYGDFIVRNAGLKITTYNNNTVYKIIFTIDTYVEPKINTERKFKYTDYIDILNVDYFQIVKLKIENEITAIMWSDFSDMIKDINFIHARKDACSLLAASVLSEILVSINSVKRD